MDMTIRKKEKEAALVTGGVAVVDHVDRSGTKDGGSLSVPTI